MATSHNSNPREASLPRLVLGGAVDDGASSPMSRVAANWKITSIFLDVVLTKITFLKQDIVAAKT